MAKPTGFLDYKRIDPKKRPIKNRLKDYNELEIMLSKTELHKQAARCMDCGVPFCHTMGCTLENIIPEFNDLLYKNNWKKALQVLHKTNNFPEITGRICPALCEAACTLAINEPAVTIKQIELQLAEKGWEQEWITPEISENKTGKKIAIVGSGPAGLAAAQQLARLGHSVTVFEKDDRIGGLLRYGIPDFKLEKFVLDRRIDQMKKEGVIFETSTKVGQDISANYLNQRFDAVLITAGATIPRDLSIPGRDFKGIHFAMDFLKQNNKRVAGDKISKTTEISAKGKNVVVIGGGDTGSDCIGTSLRQGAKSVVQIELLPKPPEDRAENNPWPDWPLILRTSSSQQEGCERMWSINSKEFIGKNEKITSLNCVKLDWSKPDKNGRSTFDEIKKSEFKIKADLVLLAMGFIHVEHGLLVSENKIETDARGNIIIDENYMTNKKGVFAAGDAASGASLVLKAISTGRKAAEKIDEFLM